MADGYIFANNDGITVRIAWARPGFMNNRAILDITAVANADFVNISSNHYQWPNRYILSQHNIANHYGGGVDIGTLL